MVRITVWNDYICPWAYAARPQTAWLRAEVAGRQIDAQAVTVAVRGFELHPDLPPEGAAVRPGGRLDQVFDHIATECAKRNQPFVKPSRTPNSQRVLALADLVHAEHLDAFASFDDAVAKAHWVEGQRIDDDRVLSELLSGAGIDPALLDRVGDEGRALLDYGRCEAMDVGATATPTWQINDLVVTGLHDDAQFRRWIGRILDRST